MSAGSPYPLTPATLQVNDQLLPAPQGSMFHPANVTGPSISGGPRGFATIPVGVGTTLGVNGTGGTQGNLAAANPLSPTQAPVIALVVMALAGLAILHFVTYRKSKD